jgi:prolyl-tRNA editing enzyme YbaK/EbsC (Cys-tRNA(Pro) deacylase)
VYISFIGVSKFVRFVLLLKSAMVLLSPSTENTSNTANDEDTKKSLQHLTSLVENAENKILYSQLKNTRPTDQSVHEQVQRAYNSVVIHHNIYSSVFKWVPEKYYSLTLAQRAKILGAQSTWQLCKSMLMENKAFDPSLSSDDGSYSQFYLVVLQYETTISTKKLVSEIRALKKPVTKRYDTNKFDFRLASSADNDKLTGYTHNAVSPFGLLDSKSVTIILAKSIQDMGAPFIWMGGGHVHCKVGMAANDFIGALNPLVLDVTEPRNGNEEMDS